MRQPSGNTKLGLASFRHHVDNQDVKSTEAILKGKPGRKRKVCVHACESFWIIVYEIS